MIINIRNIEYNDIIHYHSKARIFTEDNGLLSTGSYIVNLLLVGYVHEFCFDQKQQHNPFPSFLLNLVDLLTELLSVFQVDVLSCLGIK